MQIRVTLAVEVDAEAWAEAYNVGADDVPADAAKYLQGQILNGALIHMRALGDMVQVVGASSEAAS